MLQNIDRIEAARPDAVAVFSADHVYRMDVRHMLALHRASDADSTVATVPVPVHQCHHFGIVQTDARGRVTSLRLSSAATCRPRAPEWETRRAMPRERDLGESHEGAPAQDFDCLLHDGPERL